MKIVLSAIVCVMLVGCSPPTPVPKEKHVKQVQGSIAKAGGVTNILNESRTLFLRLARQTNRYSIYDATDKKCFEGLSGITNLGDVFYYESYEPDRIQVRIHNSHSDTYLICLLNPDLPQPAGFEQIAGNVGFIDEEAASQRR